jgi:cytochrome c-type biogenesis protein CcmH
MIFWTIAAFITISCVLAALLPLVRPPAEGTGGHNYDIEVYKDQLTEIERDAAQGSISAGDAQTARNEVSRRIIKLGSSNGIKVSHQRGGRVRQVSAIVIAAIVPILSWGGYTWLGTPELPDLPMSARALPKADENSIGSLLAKAEDHLKNNPQDGRGWEVLAPIYSRMGRYDSAVMAWTRSIELNGENAQRQSGLGEAMAGAAGGKVTPDARKAFDRALALEPAEPKARLFVAISLAQEGKSAEAQKALEEQLANSAPDAPWRPVVENVLASLRSSANGANVASGPSQGDVEAAAQMSAPDRLAMIEGMIEGLALKLKENPSDVDGWQRLMRSYMVLGKKDDAAKALDTAQSALKLDTAKLAQVQAFAKKLGLDVK